MHDEGDTAAIRKLARKSRRAAIAGSRFGTGHLNVPFNLLIDDPAPRNSAQSYFIQLADLCAYAAFRRIHPPPSHRGAVCPQQTWDELGTAIFGDVNALARGTGTGDPVGIVNWPREPPGLSRGVSTGLPHPHRAVQSASDQRTVSPKRSRATRRTYSHHTNRSTLCPSFE
jgi:hypothetical protein